MNSISFPFYFSVYSLNFTIVRLLPTKSVLSITSGSNTRSVKDS